MLQRQVFPALVGGFFILGACIPAHAVAGSGSATACTASTPVQYVFSGSAPQVVPLIESVFACGQESATPLALVGVCNGSTCRLDARGRDAVLSKGNWMLGKRAARESVQGDSLVLDRGLDDRTARFALAGTQWPVRIPALNKRGTTSPGFAGVCAGLNCSFHAAPGIKAPYEWDFGDGNVAQSDGPVVYHRFTIPGKQTVQLFLDDGMSVRTTFNGKNAAPRADFRVLCLNGSCTFDTQASFDIDGDIVSYAWHFADGSEASGPLVVRRQRTAERVSLTVTDDQGVSVAVAKDVVPGVTSAFGKPASFSGAWFNPALDGSGINILRRDDDPNTPQDERALVVYYYGFLDDGSGLLWLISNPLFGDASEITAGADIDLEMLKGNSGSLNTPTPLDPDVAWGTLTLDFDSCNTGKMELHSSASEGDITRTDIQRLVAIGRLNDCGETGSPPVVALTVQCPNLSCTFDANTTVSSGREVKFYNWFFGDDVALQGDATLNALSHTYTDDSRDFLATVIVTDSVGDATRITHPITNLVNAPPDAVLTFGACNQVSEGGKIRCNFDASASSDPDGDSAALIFQWDFGDGSGLTGGKTTNVMFTHDYAAPGSFEVTLNVRDTLGALTSITRTLDANETPVAAFTSTCNINGNPLKCNFDPAASSDDGSISRYSWDFGDASAIVAGGSSTAQNHTYPAPGQYTVALTVTDDSGKTDTHEEVETLVIGASPVADFTFSCDPSTFTCTYTSTSSDAEDPNLSDFQWDFGDGTTGSGSPTSRTYADGSMRTVTLTVTDADLNRSSKSKTVDPASNNTPPSLVQILTASCPQPGLVCQFEAVGTDPDNDPLTFQWDFDDSTMATGKALNHTYAADGSYDVTVTADDGNGGSLSSSVRTVNVAAGSSSPPPTAGPLTADFTVDSCPNNTCTFSWDSANSTVTPTKLVWHFGDGNFKQGNFVFFSTVTYHYANAGTFPVMLSVENTVNGVLVDSDSKTQNVGVPGGIIGTPPPGGGSNNPPVANFLPITCNGLTCTFDGQPSDPDGDPLTSLWNFGDGLTSNLKSTNHTYAQAGTYTATYTVSDGRGGSDSKTSQPFNAGAVGAPIAAFSVTNNCQNGVDNTRLCQFDASASRDTPDGAGSTGVVVSYAWNFGDGTTGTGINPGHAYAAAGAFNVMLTVTDNSGNTDNINQSVSAIGDKPVANFSFNCAGLQCSFDATTSLALVDPIDAYSWDFAQGGSSIGTSTGSGPLFSFPAPGTYNVTLIVTDQGTASLPTTKTFTVTTSTSTSGPYDGRTPGDPFASFTWSISNGFTYSFTDTSQALEGQLGGTITTRAWDFGDGLNATAANPVHTYGTVGTRTVILTVTNSGGLSNTMARTVTVVATDSGSEDQAAVSDTTLYRAPLVVPQWCNSVVTTPPAPFVRATGTTPGVVFGNPDADATHMRWFSDFKGGNGTAQDYNLDKEKYMAAGFVANPPFLSVANPAGGTQWVLLGQHPDFGRISTAGRTSMGQQGLAFAALSQCPGDFEGRIKDDMLPDSSCTSGAPILNPDMLWTLPGKAPGRCELQLGKTYFYNTIYSDPPNYIQRTCNPKLGQTWCSFIVTNFSS